MTEVCQCVNHHRPLPLVIEHHHVVPIAWGGENYRKVPLCATAHDNVHHLLNAYVRSGGTPRWDVLKHHSPYIRTLAWEAWQWWLGHGGGGVPKYTTRAG